MRRSSLALGGTASFPAAGEQGLDVTGENLKTASEFGVPERSPTIASGEGQAAHKVTSSGMMPSSLA
jgi:hypothetical protein